jgi:hypothetical protein
MLEEHARGAVQLRDDHALVPLITKDPLRVMSGISPM